MCPVCNNERHAFRLPFSIVGIQRSISEIFHNASGSIKLTEFPLLLKQASMERQAWGTLKGACCPRKTIPAYYVEFFVLELIASNIINCCPVTSSHGGKVDVVVKGILEHDGISYPHTIKGAFVPLTKSRRSWDVNKDRV